MSVDANSLKASESLTSLTVRAFCEGETRQHTTAEHCVVKSRKRGLSDGSRACRKVSPSMTTAKPSEGLVLGSSLALLILSRPASICARAPISVSDEIIIISMALVRRLQLKPISMAV